MEIDLRHFLSPELVLFQQVSSCSVLLLDVYCHVVHLLICFIVRKDGVQGVWKVCVVLLRVS